MMNMNQSGPSGGVMLLQQLVAWLVVCWASAALVSSGQTTERQSFEVFDDDSGEEDMAEEEEESAERDKLGGQKTVLILSIVCQLPRAGHATKS